MDTVRINFVGRAQTHFDYPLGNCRNLGLMRNLCEAFNCLLSEISTDLSGNELIAEIEKVRKEALSRVFGTEEPDSKTYTHESKKLSTTAFALRSGHLVNSPDDARQKVGNWDNLLKGIRGKRGVQNEETTGNSVTIPNIVQAGNPFIFSWNGNFKSGIIRSFCQKFGSQLRNIPFCSGDKNALKDDIESARDIALRNVFLGDDPKDQTYIDISDRIAVIAFAIRSGHPGVRTFEEAKKATGLNHLRDEEVIDRVNGDYNFHPRALSARARLINPQAHKAQIKNNQLEIANRAGERVFTKENQPTWTTKPEVKGNQNTTDLICTTFLNQNRETPSYTFINSNSGELIGSGKLKRVVSDACVFEVEGTRNEKSAYFSSSSLIVREIKPSGIVESNLDVKSGQVNFNPKADPTPVMGIYSSGDILGIDTSDGKVIIGKYLDFHQSDSGSLIIWFQDGRCIKAQNKEITIQAYREL